MKRFRDCGCDCRDADQIYVGDKKEPICCQKCPEEKRPCLYVARFGCRIPDPSGFPFLDITPSPSETDPVAGNVYMRVLCPFPGNCKYKSIYAPTAPGRSMPHNIEANQDTYDDAIVAIGNRGCDWGNRVLMFTEPWSPVFPWTLDLDQTPVTLDHVSGAHYEAVSEWVCDGPNTLRMTTVGTGTGAARADGGIISLPNSVCVTPGVPLDINECSDKIPCGYASSELRCACGDACCDCLPGSITVSCGTGTGTAPTTASYSGNFCIGGRTGLESPAGPSRELCCTLDLPTADTGTGTGVSLQPHEICLVTYCDGVDWKSDLYIDGVFCATLPVTITSLCPLSGTVTFPPDCIDCTVTLCIGPDCNPPPVKTSCCPDNDIPQTLYVDLTFAGNCPAACSLASFPILYSEANGYWEGSSVIPGCNVPVTLRLTCVDTTWLIELDRHGGFTYLSGGIGITTVSCRPVVFTGLGSATSDLCSIFPGTAAVGVTISA